MLIRVMQNDINVSNPSLGIRFGKEFTFLSQNIYLYKEENYFEFIIFCFILLQGKNIQSKRI